MVQTLRVMDMIRHQSAPFADGTPGDRMVRITGHFDNSIIFYMQQDATARMAKAAVTSSNLVHIK
jgi:hypothetical protein